MAKNPSITLTDGTTIDVERAKLLDSGALEITDGEERYYLSPCAWTSFRPNRTTTGGSPMRIL